MIVKLKNKLFLRYIFIMKKYFNQKMNKHRAKKSKKLKLDFLNFYQLKNNIQKKVFHIKHIIIYLNV